jgi:DNA-binding IclR family transcriptional regulator
MLQSNSSAVASFVPPADHKALITERVRGEYREMPGLALTLAQAARLWSLDAATCSDVLTSLVELGYLTRRADGAFCRSSDLTGRPFRMARATIELADVAQPRRIAQG